MMRIKLNKDLELSRLVHGHWRLVDWKLTDKELLRCTEETIELGITSFDHADIYGDYNCERLFGGALALNPGLRKDIQIVTKCGIKLISDKYPERKLKTYDYSYDHIVYSVENSLKNLRTDYIDLLLLHRPAPFFDPIEVARAFSDLKRHGKVLHFGVSNFNPTQFEMLNNYTEDPLVTNQIEISPYSLEHFENGNMDYLLGEKIKPMAWSPLSAGKLLSPRNQDEKGHRIMTTLKCIQEELNLNSIDLVIYTWLLNHPSGILPILGSGKIDRLRNAVSALSVEMSQEQWYKIYNASTGVELP